MKKLVILAVAVIMAGTAFAEDATLEKKIKLTEDMLSSMDLQKNMDRSFDMVKKMQMNIVKKFSQGKDSEKALKLQAAIIDLMKKEFSWDSIKDDVVKVYAESFSEDELKALTDFYKSPVGQKLIQKQPEVQQKMMMIVQKKVMEVMPKVQAMTQQMLKEDAAKDAAKEVKKPCDTCPNNKTCPGDKPCGKAKVKDAAKDEAKAGTCPVSGTCNSK